MPTEHDTAAEAFAADHPIRCTVVTVSDTRTAETDTSGDLVASRLTDAGYVVVERHLVPDDPVTIDHLLQALLLRADVDVILTTGGTGIARRDTTIEVVRRRLTTEIEGFGELFRMVSWTEVGAAAMLSRAIGGLVVRPPTEGGDTFIFCMPGSRNACDTAMTKLLVPQLRHLVWERHR
jgi:molybdenum cofactor biosynthesis protein B